MNKINFHRTIIGVLIALNVFLVYQLLDKKHHRWGKNHHPKHRLIEQLDFDETQVAEFEQLIEKHREAVKELDGKIVNTKQAIFEQLSDDQPQVQDSLYKQIGQLQIAIEKAHFQHFLSVKALCREDQLDEFDALSKTITKVFSKHRRGRRSRAEKGN
tara:strand:+ start:1260 stop:1733 length:474 start_codon:yes stop_codon:yes gene_type:complete